MDFNASKMQIIYYPQTMSQATCSIALQNSMKLSTPAAKQIISVWIIFFLKVNCEYVGYLKHSSTSYPND